MNLATFYSEYQISPTSGRTKQILVKKFISKDLTVQDTFDPKNNVRIVLNRNLQNIKFTIGLSYSVVEENDISFSIIDDDNNFLSLQIDYYDENNIAQYNSFCNDEICEKKNFLGFKHKKIDGFNISFNNIQPVTYGNGELYGNTSRDRLRFKFKLLQVKMGFNVPCWTTMVNNVLYILSVKQFNGVDKLVLVKELPLIEFLNTRNDMYLVTDSMCTFDNYKFLNLFIFDGLFTLDEWNNTRSPYFRRESVLN